MKAINKLFIMIFCVVVAAICAITGILINSTIWKKGFIPASIERSLSWFGQHPQESKIIVITLWGLSGIFAFFAITALIGIAKDKKTTSDEDLGIEYKRLEE